MSYKIPISVLVVIYTADMQVLLLERADHVGWWQSVTGSLNPGETPEQAVVREVAEETGIDTRRHVLKNLNRQNVYEIYDCYRHRYAPGTTRNTEHVFSLLLPAAQPVTLAENEHVDWQWRPLEEAAALCFSPSNAAAIRELPSRHLQRGAK